MTTGRFGLHFIARVPDETTRAEIDAYLCAWGRTDPRAIENATYRVFCKYLHRADANWNYVPGGIDPMRHQRIASQLFHYYVDTQMAKPKVH